MDNNNDINNNNNNNNNNVSADSSTSSSSTTINPNNKDHFLRHLNKLSHKISKPTPLNLPPSNVAGSSSFIPTRPPLEPPVHPPQQQQPPVYNINKSDFRDVVQKLTGSPAHAAQPPPIHAPKPASSRLQRIRPPPLAQLSTRPPSLLNSAVNGVNPLSPLPPFPTCHAAAESPISAYMRFLHTSESSLNRTGQIFPSTSANSPADLTAMLPPFGCFPSPKSPCPLLSPTGNGTLGFPISPTVPSPKWRDL
ncbi:VQ motif-containing protein 9 [Amaranthus tricolor]|uniref:VQ motif-containing protein 9 n=1 Tax=Amaranthus tricolor TaxID=29722 RepID=UPI0025825C8B|nr:VQ motif-containing protein 9 [Amaranthus tricolor]